ncbi:hypothetical protein FB451DRAFT_1090349 [Mycena latifolia]|nr:hypothetical protein FB451DRAFT_1090349 [Mycena latifolia]
MRCASFPSATMTRYTPVPLDDTLYKAGEVALITEQSAMQDPDALRKHVLAVQAKAYDFYSYPCIRNLDFVLHRISTLPAYQEVLALGREREGAILLDLGCCLGTDIRQAASDGFPIQNLIASDIHPEFWTLGHELFRSTSETFPVPFLVGDALDSKFIEPTKPIPILSEVVGSVPSLASLTNLTPLRGHVAAIHISFVFHLFSDQLQLQLAHAIAGLLSPVHGSVIFGCHVGLPQKGFKEWSPTDPPVFCHSPESWHVMWDELFPKGSIKVDAKIRRSVSHPPDVDILVWSVTRI